MKITNRQKALLYISIPILLLTTSYSIIRFNHSYVFLHYKNIALIFAAFFQFSTFFITCLFCSKITKHIYLKIFCITFINILAFIYILISLLEITHFYVTGMTFYEVFWQLLSLDFIITSLSVNKTLSFLGIATLAISSYFTFKATTTYSKTTNKIDIIIRILLILTGVIITIHLSPLQKLINSYAQFKILTIERNYQYTTKETPKDKITASAPKNPKNIVHIIVESITDELANPELMPNISKLKKQGIHLSNLKPIVYHQYSEAGHFIANKARLNPSKKNANKKGLTYILKKAGYTNIFIRGASKTAGGFLFSKIYNKKQGIDKYITKDDFLQKTTNWGVEDSKIFHKALDEYKKLSKQSSPFYIGLFTMDTHLNQKPSKECKNLEYPKAAQGSLFLKSIYCTDYLVYKFIKELKKLPNFNNTLIIIHSDQIPLLYPQASKDNHDLLGLILNTKLKPFSQKKNTYLFDIPQTILESTKIKTNNKFMLGENITNKNFTRTQKTIKPFTNQKLNISKIPKNKDNIYLKILKFYK